MSSDRFQAIHVLSVTRGFRDPALRYQITPYRFQTKKGASHRIVDIRQVHRERSGHAFHYHYVVRTDEQLFFHLVFDTATLTWRLVQQVEEELFFNE
jgi:hypothetical protein